MDVLIIKSQQNSFEKYFSNRMASIESVTVFSTEIIDKGYFGLRKHFDITKNISKLNINKYNEIIVFDNYKLIIPLFLFKRKGTRLILWKWNTESIPIKYFSIIKHLCEIWSFDQKEARQNGYKFNTQFFFEQNSFENKENIFDLYFRGEDKGRFDLLKGIIDYSDENKLINNILMRKSAGKAYPVEYNKYITEKYTNYEDVINEVGKSKAVVDLVKDGQSGLTIRVLEALFMNKKIVTNNKDILNQHFYNEKMIFVLGEKNIDDLWSFLQSPDLNYPNEDLRYYKFENWLERFNEQQ